MENYLLIFRPIYKFLWPSTLSQSAAGLGFPESHCRLPRDSNILRFRFQEYRALRGVHRVLQVLISMHAIPIRTFFFG